MLRQQHVTTPATHRYIFNNRLLTPVTLAIDDRQGPTERKIFRARSFMIGPFVKIGFFAWWKILGRHLSSSGIVTSFFEKKTKLESWPWMKTSALPYFLLHFKSKKQIGIVRAIISFLSLGLTRPQSEARDPGYPFVCMRTSRPMSRASPHVDL